MEDQCHNQLLLTATQLRTQHLWYEGEYLTLVQPASVSISHDFAAGVSSHACIVVNDWTQVSSTFS